MKKFLIIIAFASSIFSFSFELEKKELFTSADGYQFITFVDWDSDGLIDMLETVLDSVTRTDRILFKQNVGTVKNPVYSEGKVILDENGNELAFSHGWCGGIINPRCGDINGDGIQDLIIGTISKPDTSVIRIRYGLKSGRISSSHETNFRYKVNFPRSYGNFVDYNDDGLLDIVATTQYYASHTGETNCIRIFLNNGTKTEPSFEKEFIKLKAGGNYLEGPSRSNFMTILFDDLNYDGRSDMICGVSYKGGDNTGFYYALNKSKSGEMDLGALKPILFNGTPLQFTCPVAPMGSRACISFVNTDNDNFRELFINKQSGDYKNRKYEYERYFLRDDGTNLIIDKDISLASNNISIQKDKLIFKNCEQGSIIKIYSFNGKELYRSIPINNQTLSIDKKLFSSGTYIYSLEGEKNNTKGVISIR